MDKAQLKELLDKNQKGLCTAEEQRILEIFYDSLQEDTVQDHPFDLEAKKEKVLQRINHTISKAERQEAQTKEFTIGYYVKVAATVSLVPVLAFLIWFFLSNSQKPGMLLTEKSTVAGQKSTLVLSDGTQIRLNSKSKIVFPDKFGTGTREVYLEGEAFFDVARDEHKPFIIHTGSISTQVLGTSFNIKAFPEDVIEVTVATGKVSVKNTDAPVPDKHEVLLTPNEQASFDATTGILEKKEVDIEPYLAWKEGEIILENVTLLEASEILERWYGVTIVFANGKIKNCVISSAKYKDESLYNILNSFKYFLQIDYKTEEEGKIIINGKGC